MARVPFDRIVAAGFVTVGMRRRRFSTSDAPMCQSCGELGHLTHECVHRDDQLSDTAARNGEYRGTATVRVVPPGFSFIDRYSAGPTPVVRAGQRWFSPSGVPYRVDRLIGGHTVVLERGRRTIVKCRISLTTLRTRWYFAGQEGGDARG